MTVSNLDKSLHDSIERLSDAQKLSLLEYINTIARGEEERPFTIEEYNNDLAEAEEEIERGEVYTNDEVFAMANAIINGRR